MLAPVNGYLVMDPRRIRRRPPPFNVPIPGATVHLWIGTHACGRQRACPFLVEPLPTRVVRGSCRDFAHDGSSEKGPERGVQPRREPRTTQCRNFITPAWRSDRIRPHQAKKSPFGLKINTFTMQRERKSSSSARVPAPISAPSVSMPLPGNQRMRTLVIPSRQMPDNHALHDAGPGAVAAAPEGDSSATAGRFFRDTAETKGVRQ
jgi:hypothetical protein